MMRSPRKSRRPCRRALSILPMIWLLGCASAGLWLIFGGQKAASPQPGAPHYITKNIEDVRVGDFVLAKDPNDSGSPTPHRVIALPRNWTEHVVHVRVEGGGEVLATRMHPFWVEGKGWTKAVNLSSGDRLRDERNRPLKVLSAAVERRTTGTLNLTIEGVHTYFVVAGGKPVLVHNMDDSQPPSWFSQQSWDCPAPISDATRMYRLGLMICRTGGTVPSPA